MNKEIEARFDLLDIDEKRDIADMISTLANRTFKNSRHPDRTEDEIRSSMSETALELWCDYLDSLYNCVGN